MPKSNKTIHTLWTSEMDHYLRSNWSKMTNREIAKALDLHIERVRRRLYLLGLRKFKIERWSPEEIDFVKDNFHQMGDTEIAEKLTKRSKTSKLWKACSIQKKRTQLRLQRTPQEIAEIVARNYKLLPDKRLEPHQRLKKLESHQRIKQHNEELLYTLQTQICATELELMNVEKYLTDLSAEALVFEEWYSRGDIQTLEATKKALELKLKMLRRKALLVPRSELIRRKDHFKIFGVIEWVGMVNIYLGARRKLSV